MKQPLITIGMTCHNAADTIERALESAQAQEWDNKEIVIVDDYSTDNSVDVIKRFIENNSNIRLIRHDVNKGFPSALNSILSVAKGDFVTFFDDDDYSYPNRLEEQFKRITEYGHSDFVLCYTNREVVRLGETKVDHIGKAIGRKSPEPHGEMVARKLLIGKGDNGYVFGLFGSCGLMAAKKTFDRIGEFDPAFFRGAEHDYAVRAAFLGCYFISVNSPLLRQYKTVGVQKSGKRPLLALLQLRRKHKGYLQECRLYWYSLLMAHATFHNNLGQRIRFRLYRDMAKLTKFLSRIWG